MLSIQLPDWLVNVWAVYGEIITPILVTIISTLVTVICLNIKAEAKKNAAKADLQIEALRNVADREDNKPELEAQQQIIDQLSKEVNEEKSKVIILGKMFALAFQNSALDQEAKDAIAELSNELLYDSRVDEVKELKESNEALKAQIEELSKQIAEKTIKTTEEVSKRIRR